MTMLYTFLTIVGVMAAMGFIFGLILAFANKKLAVEMIKEVRAIEGIAGVHVMAVEWESAVPEIVEAAGLVPRPAVS